MLSGVIVSYTHAKHEYSIKRLFYSSHSFKNCGMPFEDGVLMIIMKGSFDADYILIWNWR